MTNLNNLEANIRNGLQKWDRAGIVSRMLLRYLQRNPSPPLRKLICETVPRVWSWICSAVIALNVIALMDLFLSNMPKTREIFGPLSLAGVTPTMSIYFLGSVIGIWTFSQYLGTRHYQLVTQTITLVQSRFANAKVVDQIEIVRKFILVNRVTYTEVNNKGSELSVASGDVLEWMNSIAKSVFSGEALEPNIKDHLENLFVELYIGLKPYIEKARVEYVGDKPPYQALLDLMDCWVEPLIQNKREEKRIQLPYKAC
jgi:hypothetical protein